MQSLNSTFHFIVDSIPGGQDYVQWWFKLLEENPTHLYIETTLILVILFILAKGQNPTTRRHEVNDDVLAERLAAFQPTPLAPAVLAEDSQLVLRDTVVLESPPCAATCKVQGVDKPVLNFASTDFLDYGSSPEVTVATEKALDKYGVGSCGPRGFYGTIDAHVRLEEAIAQYFGANEAIIYSDASSAVASAIPAFANRSDMLVVDDGSNENIMTGVRLSRAKLMFFKHGDMADLERVLKHVEADDKRLGRRPDQQRRFVVFEGLSRNFGDIADMQRIVELKQRYKWRLLVDESLSVGVLGKTGKGVTEHCGVPVSSIEILVASLETSLASVGGFCVGSYEVVEHQRLNGAGYCFSASAPPFTATAAEAALKLLNSARGSNDLETLRGLAEHFAAQLKGDARLAVASSAMSPVVHVRLTAKYPTLLEENKALRDIARKLLSDGVALVVPVHYTPAPAGSPAPPPLSLRLFLHVTHSKDHHTRTAKALSAAAACLHKV